ncbi:MAG: hypothetical protein AABW83_01560 [Nanoarchaeota archaeon]
MNLEFIDLIVEIVLSAGIVYTLYKKKYSSAAGIGIMFVAYLLIKNKVGTV